MLVDLLYAHAHNWWSLYFDWIQSPRIVRMWYRWEQNGCTAYMYFKDFQVLIELNQFLSKHERSWHLERATLILLYFDWIQSPRILRTWCRRVLKEHIASYIYLKEFQMLFEINRFTCWKFSVHFQAWLN